VSDAADSHGRDTGRRAIVHVEPHYVHNAARRQCLHGRRADGSATCGALLGYLTRALHLFLLLMLGAIAARIATAVGLFATADDAGNAAGLTAVVAIVVACLAVVVWLTSTLRDLSPKRREHAWIDVARLVATVAFVA
jgi:hypothetical protein